MSWLSSLLSPLKLLWNGVEQTRDDRIDFTDGFIADQVPDADGVNVLTLSTEVGKATVTPTADKVVLRNGSGAVYGTTIVATAFSFATAKEITFREPIRAIEPAVFDPSTGWSINDSLELLANAISLQWQTELQLIPGSTLTKIGVVYTPENGHGALPADQPSIELIYIDYGGTPTVVETKQDNAADVAAYEAQRTLTLTLATPVSVVANRRYILQFNNETGANAEPDLVLHAPAIWTAEVTSVWA